MEKWDTWTKEELENQMSPTRWNPTKSADEVISQHLTVCADETLKARQRISHKLGISYGVSDKQKYDLYSTDLPDNAPIVLWMHGGYWQEGSKDISGVMAQNLYANGVKTIVVGYTLAPEVTVKQIQAEFYRALMAAMQENKKANFIVAGHSAGAQLAANLLHENSTELEQLDVQRISGFLLFAGVYDLRPLVSTYVNDALKLSSHEAELQSPLLQPFKWANKNVPIFLCVGAFDSPEFQRQSLAYTAKLRGLFENVELWNSPEDDHFTLVERLSCSTKASSAAQVLRFLTSARLII